MTPDERRKTRELTGEVIVAMSINAAWLKRGMSPPYDDARKLHNALAKVVPKIEELLKESEWAGAQFTTLNGSEERRDAVIEAAYAISRSRDFVPATDAAIVLEARLHTALADLVDAPPSFERFFRSHVAPRKETP